MHLGFIVEVELTKCGKCMQNIKENKRSALFAKTWKARDGEGREKRELHFMKKRVMKAILYFLETLRSISTGVLCKMRGLHRKKTLEPTDSFFFFLV